MNRVQFQKIARLRIREAQVLLQARMFDGAYYLAGYSLECGLKACIAKLVRRHEFPDKDFVKNSYTHDFARLIQSAGLDERYRDDIGLDSQLAANWRIVKDWREDSRYTFWKPDRARELLEAITASPHGVFEWIERHW